VLSVTFTATVTTSNGINISGSVSWSSNTGCATSFVPVPTAASAIVTCTTSSLPSGTVTVTGAYSGDATHATGSGSFQELVTQTVAPTVSFTGAPASAAYHATFSVASQTNASTTASYLATGACSISGTTVTMTGSTGTCTLTASWAADSNYNSATATQSTAALKATPTISWSTPASIVYGSALGNGQLKATATVAGAFVYSPDAGTVLPVGTGETLAVSFTPSDSNDYNGATGSTTINVTASATSPVNLVVTATMTRNGTISVPITVANSGGTSAANVVLTSVKVGTTAATSLPQSLGALAPGNSAQATVSVTGSVGASGAASTLSVAGTYTGGTFSSTARVTLP
jgi:hypothetical protein